MESIKHKDCTNIHKGHHNPGVPIRRHKRKPEGFSIPVNVMSSYWRPTLAELRDLNEGGVVMITMEETEVLASGNQPIVAVEVEKE